jgi:calcium/calmodulin-dependent protein kinase I
MTRYANEENYIYRDLWAIGVITYFLLCGYTPFDKDTNMDEMQAILVADYKFEPIEYWRDVSENGMSISHHTLYIPIQTNTLMP